MKRSKHSSLHAVLGLAVAFTIAVLAGCAQLGLVKPESPEDSLRYGQAVVTGIYKTVGDAAEAKAMPADEARKYFNDAKKLRGDLDTAEAIVNGLEPGGLATAEAKIRLTLASLNVIAAELRRRLPPTATVALPAPK